MARARRPHLAHVMRIVDFRGVARAARSKSCGTGTLGVPAAPTDKSGSRPRHWGVVDFIYRYRVPRVRPPMRDAR